MFVIKPASIGNSVYVLNRINGKGGQATLLIVPILKAGKPACPLLAPLCRRLIAENIGLGAASRFGPNGEISFSVFL